MQTQAYILAIVLLRTIVASLSVGNSMVYSSSDDDDDDDDENNDENDPCYKVALQLDAVAHSIKLNKVVAVAPARHTMRASYRVAYHLVAETILPVT